MKIKNIYDFENLKSIYENEMKGYDFFRKTIKKRNLKELFLFENLKDEEETLDLENEINSRDNSVMFKFEDMVFQFNNYKIRNYKNLNEIEIEKELKSEILKNIDTYKIIEKEYIDIVKELYEKFTEIYEEEITILVSKGARIELFYVAKNGYIGTLSLRKKSKSLFMINSRENDEILKNLVLSKNITIMTNESMYGNSDKESKEIKKENIETTNPLELINNVLKKYGTSERISHNPLNILLHIFLSYGNGYKLVKNEKEAFIVDEEKSVDNNNSNEEVIELLTKRVKENEDLLNIINNFIKENSFDKLKEKMKLSEKDLNELIEYLEEDNEDYKSRIESMKTIVQIKSLEEINDYQFTEESKQYFYRAENIITHYSIITKIPDNLSEDWKNVLEILMKKISLVDKTNLIDKTIKKIKRLHHY